MTHVGLSPLLTAIKYSCHPNVVIYLATDGYLISNSLPVSAKFPGHPQGAGASLGQISRRGPLSCGLTASQPAAYISRWSPASLYQTWTWMELLPDDRRLLRPIPADTFTCDFFKVLERNQDPQTNQSSKTRKGPRPYKGVAAIVCTTRSEPDMYPVTPPSNNGLKSVFYILL